MRLLTLCTAAAASVVLMSPRYFCSLVEELFTPIHHIFPCDSFALPSFLCVCVCTCTFVLFFRINHRYLHGGVRYLRRGVVPRPPHSPFFFCFVWIAVSDRHGIHFS